MVNLTIHQTPPPGLFECAAKDLQALLGGPSCIHIKGQDDKSIFVSTLLHGNETSGWEGIKEWLHSSEPTCSLFLFIGNPEAAAAGVRRLPHQHDFNRVWNTQGLPESIMADQVISEITKFSPNYAIDIHNNTGENPHYSVVTNRLPETLKLAHRYSNLSVYMEKPDTVLSKVAGEICPSIALEAGISSNPNGAHHIASFLDSLAREEPHDNFDPLRLLDARALVRILPKVEFSFCGDKPITLNSTLEGQNFAVLDAGTEFAHQQGSEMPFEVINNLNQIVTHRYFKQVGERIVLTQSVIPAMFTTELDVIKQDCLCYFMEPTL